ncbi:dual specificity mitogen-activated protein kinase kinase 4-like isoform X2 [Ruditapes philippinarum]|uniref:dual specificity mitogen-activated protein kinase kinase 4-like isoform X2 n=1 Tax=Ruditapes philippinarum TaxID=129788 RepID=UPI00295BCD75|nr:dual specificity mitogen-activated protein kinase kinase 4-like isoform X2 [Ruditapes philippinarum]
MADSQKPPGDGQGKDDLTLFARKPRQPFALGASHVKHVQSVPNVRHLGFSGKDDLTLFARKPRQPFAPGASHVKHVQSAPNVRHLGFSDNSLGIRSRLQLNFKSQLDNQNGGSAPTLKKLGYMTQIERLRSHGGLESSGKLQVKDKSYNFTADDLKDLGEIGRGNYGTVNKMLHEKSETIMSVKRIRSVVDEKEQRQMLMELDAVMRSNDCPYIVQFYGALFKEGDCWICMELMDISLDKFYKFTYGHLKSSIPEEILGKITVATVKALNYLKEKLKIIHRDVKPSNILLDRKGNIKLCDFGISGQLVDSIAKSRDAGCRPYMAPERIDPHHSSRGYDVRSDIWSLGITLMELATGRFPYPKWNSVFDQLTQVVQGPAPQLNPSEGRFSEEFLNFLGACLTKEERQRPKYNKLLEHPFIKRYQELEVDTATYFNSVLDQVKDSSLLELSQSS